MSSERRRLGVFGRIAMLTVGLVLVTALTVAGSAAWLYGQRLESALIETGRSTAGMLAMGAEYGVYTKDEASLKEVVRTIEANPLLAYAGVFDADGALLAFHSTRPGLALPPQPGADFTTRVEGGVFFDLSAPVMSTPTLAADPLDPSPIAASQRIGTVRVGLSSDAVREGTWSVGMSTAVLTLFVAGLAVALSLVLVRRITLPLRVLVHAATRIASGDLDSRLPPATPDEVGDLARAFAGMQDSMRQDMEAQRASLEQRAVELRQALQDATRLAEQARIASRAKSEFLANMSHELRTPLNAVIGYSEMLLEELTDSEEASHDLRRIHASGAHLLHLIDGVLDLARIEAGRTELNLGEIQLDGLLDEVVATVQPMAARNGNTLDVVRPPGLGRVSSDDLKLRQILLNLLSNACKFTQHGEVTLRCSTDGWWLRFEVADTGIGMTPDQAAQIFRPFVQADSSSTRRFSGTGLGLTISRSFAELMGGTLEVTSEAGQGSTFVLVLPIEGQSTETGPGSLHYASNPPHARP